jgi:hypothetical protein
VSRAWRSRAATRSRSRPTPRPRCARWRTGRWWEAEVLEDPALDVAVRNESDELALPAAPGAGEDVDLEDALSEARPRWPWILAWVGRMACSRATGMDHSGQSAARPARSSRATLLLERARRDRSGGGPSGAAPGAARRAMKLTLRNLGLRHGQDFSSYFSRGRSHPS